MKLKWIVYLVLACAAYFTVFSLVRSNREWEATKRRAFQETLKNAAGNGDLPAVRAAVEAGTDVDSGLLERAVGGLQVDVVRYLLDHGADPNGTDPSSVNGQNPLVRLCWYHYPPAPASVIPIAKLLLEHGADPNARCCASTPLAGAKQGAYYGHGRCPMYGLKDSDGLDLVTLLQQYGAHD